MTAPQIRRPRAGVATTRLAATAALIVATLLAAASASAALVVTTAERSIHAFAEGSDPQQVEVTTLSGLFNEAVEAVQFLDNGQGAVARAEQTSDIAATSLVGAGRVEALMHEGGAASANSFDTIFFTLTTAFNVVSSVDLGADGDIRSLAGVRFEQLGPDAQVLFDGNEASGTFEFSATLQPGDYQLSAFALASGPVSFDPLSVGGSARFAFSIIFVEHDIDPPDTRVPEPLSASLVLVALGGALAARRRRPLGAAAPATKGRGGSAGAGTAATA